MDQDLEIEEYIMLDFGDQKNIKEQLDKLHLHLERDFIFFYSSISGNMKTITSTEKLFTFVKKKKQQYFAFNLYDNPMCQQWVKQQRLNQDPLPFIFINKVYIGSMDELQLLIDFKLFDPILKQEYLKQCLVCKTQRESLENEKCLNCQINYIFFEKVKICPKYREKQKDDQITCEKCEVECIRINEIFIHLKEIQ